MANVIFKRGALANLAANVDADALIAVNKVKSSSDTAYSRLYIGGDMVGCGHTFARGTAGLVPAAPSGSGTTKYLREDGSWVQPGVLQQSQNTTKVYYPLLFKYSSSVSNETNSVRYGSAALTSGTHLAATADGILECAELDADTNIVAGGNISAVQNISTTNGYFVGLLYPNASLSDASILTYLDQPLSTVANQAVDDRPATAKNVYQFVHNSLVYDVTNQAATAPQVADGTGTFTGTISSVSAYFEGLKFVYNLDNVPGVAGNMNMSLNSLTAYYIYDYKGSIVSTEYMSSIGDTILEYSEQIPNESDPTSPKTGFKLLGLQRDVVQLVGDNRYLKRTGGSMSGNINMSNHSITNVNTPVNQKDAANKKYVDDQISAASTTVTNNVIAALTEVDCNPDVLLDEVDGTKPVSVCRIEFEKKEFSHNMLGLETAMNPDTTIHLFVYCPYDGGGDNTYGSVSPTITIPSHFTGRGSSTITNDYTWINGQPTYIGTTGTGGNAYQAPTDFEVQIPSMGFVEISIFFNVFTINNVEYSRTIIKCE